MDKFFGSYDCEPEALHQPRIFQREEIEEFVTFKEKEEPDVSTILDVLENS